MTACCDLKYDVVNIGSKRLPVKPCPEYVEYNKVPNALSTFPINLWFEKIR